MKFKVTAICVDTTTTPPTVNRTQRTEEIDTLTNRLFKNADTLQDVEETYEAFWNWINNPDRLEHPKEKVKVIHVEKLSR